MAAPTFVAAYPSPVSITTTTPKTTSVTVAANELLVVLGWTDYYTRVLATPTGGSGFTWTLNQSVVQVASNVTNVYIWSAVATTSQTFTLSVAASGGGTQSYQLGWTFQCLRFSAGASIGAGTGRFYATATGATATSITTSTANAAVVCAVGDYNAISGASRVYRTDAGAFSETAYYTLSGDITLYGGYHADAGAAGAKTVGITTPSNQRGSLVAVEVTGPADAPPTVTGSILPFFA